MSAAVISEARVPVAPYQQVPGTDLTAMGTLGQGSLDNVVLNCLLQGAGYTGMSAAQVGTSNIVAVQPGYLIKGGPAYSLRDPFNVDVSAAIASVPDNTKTAIVAIVADGQEFPTTETRTFVDASKLPTDPTTPAPTVTQATPTRVVRSVVISSPVGTPDVQPVLPAYNAALCLVATVVVSNTGIVSVTQETDTQITRLDQMMLLVAALQDFQNTVQPIIAALQSSVSALSLSVSQKFGSLNTELAADEARLSAIEQRLSAPQAVLRDVDYFTDLSRTDTTQTTDAFTLSQGLSFPAGGYQDEALVPQNLYAAGLSTFAGGRYIMPAFTEVHGAESLAFAGLPIQILRLRWNTFAVFAATLLMRGFSVWRVRWAKLLAQVSTSQVILAGDPNYIFAIQPGDLAYNAALYGDWRTATLELVRLSGYWRDTAARGFWTPVLSQPTVSLPVIAQGYTPSGDQMVTSVEVGCEVIGGGDLRMVMTRSLNGFPDPTKTVADVTVVNGSLGRTSTKFVLPYPVLVKGGETCFFKFFTSGAHQLRITAPTFLARLGGPIVVWNGNGWQVVALGVEIGMRVNVAQFTGGATRVPLNALTLAGGIDAVDIVANSIVPTGCSIDYEAQVGGSYVPLAANTGTHPLAGRPSNLPINLILTGTQSTAPIVDLQGAKARVSAQGGNLQHTSVAEVPTVTAHTVNKSIIVAGYNGAVHTITAQLLIGTGYATATAPTTVTDTVQADGSLLRQFTWAVSGGVSAFKARLLATTTDPTQGVTIRQSNTDAES